MSKNDGGTAFPVREDYCESQGHYRQYASDGMSLRDYFAAKAISGLMANIELLRSTVKKEQSQSEAESEVARAAYAIADAMLAERAQ